MLERASWYVAAAAAAALAVTLVSQGCQVTCTTNADCGDKSYCSLTSGDCLQARAVGFCKSIPESCPDVASPVCACDGKPYANECEAARAGASVAATGDCSTACGGPSKATCDDGKWCHYADGVCGTADALGSCDALPAMCDGTSSGLVCGCDGKTYPSRCDAESAGISVWVTGGCPCNAPFGSVTCADGEYCDFGMVGACLSANASGTCKPKPTSCPGVQSIVCGCDGKTYDNECKAGEAGASIAFAGSCPEMADAGDGG
jgi:hypothetical protein